MAKRLHVAALRDDRFGEEKSGGEIEVIARRPQRHRHRLVADANLERLLDHDRIVVRASWHADDADARGLSFRHRRDDSRRDDSVDSAAAMSQSIGVYGGGGGGPRGRGDAPGAPFVGGGGGGGGG